MNGPLTRGLATVGGLLLCAAIPAQAQTLEEARRVADEGRFLEAADMGEALDTSEGQALAAYALAIYGFHVAAEADQNALYQRAMKAADRAVKLDAENADAWLQSSHAMGRYAQAIGPLDAFAQGFAKRTRTAIDNALALEPNMGLAHLALAGWHAEIVAAGMMARLLYDADEDVSREHCDTARRLEPSFKIVHLDCAEYIRIMGGTDEEVRALLEEAISLPAETAYAQLLDARAREALDALNDR